jgi:hypothetical protein
MQCSACKLYVGSAVTACIVACPFRTHYINPFLAACQKKVVVDVGEAGPSMWPHKAAVGIWVAGSGTAFSRDASQRCDQGLRRGQPVWRQIQRGVSRRDSCRHLGSPCTRSRHVELDELCVDSDKLEEDRVHLAHQYITYWEIGETRFDPSFDG